MAGTLPVRDHPRVCGEHTRSTAFQPPPLGSPPRVRGALTSLAEWSARAGITPACAGCTTASRTPVPGSTDHPRVCGEHRPRGRPGQGTAGITPACAGSTRAGRCSPCRRGDHPRVCGEHRIGFEGAGGGVGSPPRVRGARELGPAVHVAGGITPACAGSTLRAWPATTSPGDHPRVCGEHSNALRSVGTREGSPPRVRGARISRTPTCKDMGITPACAGSTSPSWLTGCVTWDHPRVCGEHTHAMSSTVVPSGSPPRVRGAREGPGRRHLRPGITPACAGSTAGLPAARACPTDHPRVCGEHDHKTTGAVHGEGSPPRVRGARCRVDLQEVGVRITPACAGSTGQPAARRCARRDHPRVCGEHRVEVWGYIGTDGSPPRVRGARSGAVARSGVAGITPACAGSTTVGVAVVVSGQDHPRVCGEHGS